MKSVESLLEKSKHVIDSPASAARSRTPPALRGLTLSAGLCSFTILNLEQKNNIQI